MNNPIEYYKNFSLEKIKSIKNFCKEHFGNEFCIVTFGSYARLEASKNSDLDFDFLTSNCSKNHSDNKKNC